MNDLPNPLTPADCNLRDFGFMPLDVKRLLTSETWILGTGEERAAAITLWLESWHQVPAASLPDDDRMLAHLSQSKSWKKVKPHALRGWVKCADGRFYHPVVAEKSLEAWIEKLLASLSGAAGNAKRWGVEVDIDAISARVIEAVDLLKVVAPQSKTLRKKQVVSIVSGSQPDKKPIAPRSPKKSPPESPPDRNREGEGHRELKDKTSGSSSGIGTPSASDETSPMLPAAISIALIGWERERNKQARGITASNQQVIELAALHVTSGELRRAYEGAVADRRASDDPNPINAGFIRTFIEKYRRPQARPAQQQRLTPDEQRRAISERNAAAWLAGDPESDPTIIDMEH